MTRVIGWLGWILVGGLALWTLGSIENNGDLIMVAVAAAVGWLVWRESKSDRHGTFMPEPPCEVGESAPQMINRATPIAGSSPIQRSGFSPHDPLPENEYLSHWIRFDAFVAEAVRSIERGEDMFSPLAAPDDEVVWWLARMRRSRQVSSPFARRNGDDVPRMTDNRAEALEAIPGFSWDLFSDDVLWTANALNAIRSTTIDPMSHHCRIDTEEFQRGVFVGLARSESRHPDAMRLWLRHQKEAYDRGRLTLCQRELLEEIPGWVQFETIRAEVRDRLGAGESIESLEGDFSEDVGAWLWERHSEKSDGTISTALASELESLPGWRWLDVRRHRQEQFLQSVAAVIERHGTLVATEDPLLRLEILQFQQLRSSGAISPDLERALDELPGWEWEPKAGEQVGYSTPGIDDFLARIESAPEVAKPSLRKAAEWAAGLESLGVNVQCNHGDKGTLALVPYLPFENDTLIAVRYDDTGAVIALLRTPLEERAPNSLPRVEAAIAPNFQALASRLERQMAEGKPISAEDYEGGIGPALGRVVKGFAFGLYTEIRNNRQPGITDELLDALTAAYSEAIDSIRSS